MAADFAKKQNQIAVVTETSRRRRLS